MVEITKEICSMCGQEYEDAHIVPRAPFAPYWCDKCTEEANEACDSIMGCIYGASKNPWEEAV